MMLLLPVVVAQLLLVLVRPLLLVLPLPLRRHRLRPFRLSRGCSLQLPPHLPQLPAQQLAHSRACRKEDGHRVRSSCDRSSLQDRCAPALPKYLCTCRQSFVGPGQAALRQLVRRRAKRAM